MPRQVCLFWDDVAPDGWARVTRMHHQPANLPPEVRAEGILAALGPTPEVREGWTVALHVQPSTGAVDWRITMDRDYRMSAAEFLLQLPVATRIAARQAAAAGDVAMQDFIDMIDRMITDSACKGLHPGGAAAKAALAYLVDQGWIAPEVAAQITEP